jgi:hypothetical protein
MSGDLEGPTGRADDQVEGLSSMSWAALAPAQGRNPWNGSPFPRSGATLCRGEMVRSQCRIVDLEPFDR